MSSPYSLFVSRFLARGAVGVSVGLSAVALSTASQASQDTTSPVLRQAFSERLQTLRSAIPESTKAEVAAKPVIVAQFRNID
jgi:hypothetical protein